MGFLIVLVLAVTLNFNGIYSDICADIDYDCDACLGNSFHCVWCTDEVHNDTRCRLERNPIVNSDWCQNIVNPVTEPAKIIKNEVFRPKTKTAAAVQLKPQRVEIKTRPRETVKFPMSYKPDLERPIDVYYLFDNSKLATLYKKHFDTQVPEIYEALREISGDVRFGIGSLNTITIQSSENKKVFRNILSFTKDISRSVDGHESGSYISTLLQGLMEAVESEEINGINYGRRTTVTLFCDPRTSAVDANTTLQEEYKYINTIKNIVQNKHINIIFIGQKDFPDEYKVLAKKFIGASYVELNDIDGDHVPDLVSLIKDEYSKTVHYLELTFGFIPPHLSVEVTPACEKFGSRCIHRVQAGTTMHILVAIFMSQCPNDYKYQQTVTITAIGSHETLSIDTEALCYCKCKEKIEADSDKCNLMGDYSCGICKCKEGRYGDSCQCIGDVVEDGWAKCRDTPWDYTCNGHGDCICGECSCYQGYEGQHCGDVVVKH